MIPVARNGNLLVYTLNVAGVGNDGAVRSILPLTVRYYIRRLTATNTCHNGNKVVIHMRDPRGLPFAAWSAWSAYAARGHCVLHSFYSRAYFLSQKSM